MDNRLGNPIEFKNLIFSTKIRKTLFKKLVPFVLVQKKMMDDFEVSIEIFAALRYTELILQNLV